MRARARVRALYLPYMSPHVIHQLCEQPLLVEHARVDVDHLQVEIGVLVRLGVEGQG